MEIGLKTSIYTTRTQQNLASPVIATAPQGPQTHTSATHPVHAVRILLGIDQNISLSREAAPSGLP